ncbi:MAG: phosphatidylserine decarboxylase [Lachnospiraceae bacterium]|nr:phosphatidylserine decarboxylase [Lachnospiraceae bacterium]
MRKKSQNDPSVEFLYNTAAGRCILKFLMNIHADRLMVRFLWSPLSRFVIKGYARKHGIPLTDEQRKQFRSFRDFFARKDSSLTVDQTPGHLISPCDGWLSAYKIQKDSTFAIKNSTYRISDFLQDEELAKTYEDGSCLIFRLCASDYHHYCYIDHGYQGNVHEIPGVLHSVQPIVCEKLPVFVLNKRAWTLLTTEHFGPVVQTEIGAFVVGGIVNPKTSGRFTKGEEKGHFELAGSTIILLFQKGKMQLRSDLIEQLRKSEEVRVRYGSYIGDACGKKADA